MLKVSVVTNDMAILVPSGFLLGQSVFSSSLHPQQQSNAIKVIKRAVFIFFMIWLTPFLRCEQQGGDCVRGKKTEDFLNIPSNASVCFKFIRWVVRNCHWISFGFRIFYIILRLV